MHRDIAVELNYALVREQLALQLQLARPTVMRQVQRAQGKVQGAVKSRQGLSSLIRETSIDPANDSLSRTDVKPSNALRLLLFSTDIVK